MILEICDDIENLIYEVEDKYILLEDDNEEIENLYNEIVGYKQTINIYRDKKIIEINKNLLEKIQVEYDDFKDLYYDFTLFCDEIDEQKNNFMEENVDEDTALMMGYAVNELFNDYKEEKEEEN